MQWIASYGDNASPSKHKTRNAARARVCDAASDHGGISRIEPDPDMPSLTYYTCRDGTRMAVGPEVKEAPYAEFGGF